MGKRFFNSFMCFVFALLFTFSLTSCKIDETMIYDILEKTKLLDLLEDRELKYIDSLLEKIFNAIAEKQSDTLKGCFSKKACKDSGNIEGEIEACFNFFQDDLVSWEWDELPLFVEDTKESGNMQKLICLCFTIKTKNDNYSVFLYDYPIDEINPDNEGLYTMFIIKEEDEDKLTGTVDGISSIPGITIHN